MIDPNRESEPAPISAKENRPDFFFVSWKEIDFIDKMRALTKRQAAESLDRFGVRQRAFYPLLQKRLLSSFVRGIEPKEEANICQQFLLSESSVIAISHLEPLHLDPPDCPKDRTPVGASKNDRGKAAADMAQPVCLSNQRKEKSITG